MKNSTLLELRSRARALQNRSRISAMDDVDFFVSVMRLINDTERAFEGIEQATCLLSQASSYATSAHMELALAAIQALFVTIGCSGDDPEAHL
jgi:hypothetical protein